MTESELQAIEALVTNTTNRCHCCGEPAEIRQCDYFQAMDKIAPVVAEVRRLQRRPFVARMHAALAERVAEVRSLREALREVAAQGHHENCYLMMRHEDAQCSCPWSVATEALR